MNSKTYNEKDIKVLTDQEHVRLRLPVYAGSTKTTQFNVPLFVDGGIVVKQISFVPATYKCVGEVIENSIDELIQTDITKGIIEIEADTRLGIYTIRDNGRGVPIGKHESGKYTPEIVFSQLRSGRNFHDDKEAGVIGMNGMGAAITCMTSLEFKVEIARDKHIYRQTFIDGGKQVNPPVISKTRKKETGTTITFQLDPSVFEDITLPEELMRNRAMELALTNPGLTVIYNGTKYLFRRGFEDFIRKASKEYYKFQTSGIEFFVLLDVNHSQEEQVHTWVNSSLLFDGGICNTQFINAFCDQTISSLNKEAKKAKCEVTKNDVREGLLVIGNLKLANPQYDAQSKTRLTGPSLRRDIDKMLKNQWSSFIRKQKHWLSVVLERATVRYHAKANKKAVKEHQKKSKRRIPGLVDATSKYNWEKQLLLTEGLSAASMITQARDPKIHASLPLTGKINNVYGTTVAQLLKMGKISDLITAIGLIPGKKALRSELNYGKVVIATDSDVDGGDIFTLLVNLFFQFWPELFDSNYEPFVYRLIAPNICAVKGNERVHFPSRSEFEKVKAQYKGWTINYYKGLGSMVQKDWEMILSGKTNTLIPIIDDGKLKDTLLLLFGPDSNARKKWLQGE